MIRYVGLFGAVVLLSGTTSPLAQQLRYDPWEPFQAINVVSPLGVTAFMPLVQLHHELTELGFRSDKGRNALPCSWFWSSEILAPPPNDNYSELTVKIAVTAAPTPADNGSNTYCAEDAVVKSFSFERNDRANPGSTIEKLRQLWLTEVARAEKDGDCTWGPAAFSGNQMRCLFDERLGEDVDYILAKYTEWPNRGNSGSIEVHWMSPKAKASRDAERSKPDPCAGFSDPADRLRCIVKGRLEKFSVPR